MRRTSIWQKVAWPLLLWVLWLPTMVHAGNEMENSYHWMITPSGVNTVDIQMPVYDCAGLDGFVIMATSTSHPMAKPRRRCSTSTPSRRVATTAGYGSRRVSMARWC